MSDDKESVTSVILRMLVLMALWPWCGYVGAVLWGWFLVPLGVREITCGQYMGVALLIGYIRAKPDTKVKPASREWADVIAYSLMPLMALGMGALLRLFTR